MDKTLEKNNMKSKNESEILKEKQDDSSNQGSPDLSIQNIIHDVVQKNDITLKLNKNNIKKKHHYYNKGKVYMFFFNRNEEPRIVIGPNCKKIIL